MEEPTRIARNVLAQYPVALRSLEFTGHGASAVYQLTDCAGRRFSLRVHKPRCETLENCRTTRETIRSEMMWMLALSRETDITLPVPVPNNRGELVTIMDGVA